MKAMRYGLAVVALLGVAAQAASADKCKSPKIIVKNDKGSAIKVTKIQYYDACDKQWRTENVPETEIPAGAQRSFTDNLEYVGNCAVSKFKLYRAVRQSTGAAYGAFDWGAELVPDEGSSQTCNTGVVYTIHAFDK